MADLSTVTKKVWDSIRTDNPNDYGESLWRCSLLNNSWDTYKEYWDTYKEYLNKSDANVIPHADDIYDSSLYKKWTTTEDYRCYHNCLNQNYRGSVWRDITPSEEFIRQKCTWQRNYDYEYCIVKWRCTYKDDIIGTVASEFVLDDVCDMEIPFIPVEKKRETENKVIEAVQKIYREQYYRREFGMNIKESAIFEENMKMAHGRIVEVHDQIGVGYRAVIELDANMLKNIRIEMPKTDFDKKGCTCNKYTANGIPAVSKVEVYNDRVVKVTFTDGTFTKSVCSENDAFDIDVGITVCVMKRMLGKDGNKLYNNMIRDIHETMEKNIKEKEEAIAKKAEERNKKRKVELKKAAKKAKARQEQIDIQKTAMVEALHAYKMETGDDMK